MLIFEYKLRGNKEQSAAIDEAIRIVQFIRNKALRLWMDTRGANGYDLNGACRELVNTCRLPTSSRTGNSPKASVTLPGAASCCGSPTMGMSITFPSLPLSLLLRVRIVPHVEHGSRKASQSGHISALVVGWCLTEITIAAINILQKAFNRTEGHSGTGTPVGVRNASGQTASTRSRMPRAGKRAG